MKICIISNLFPPYARGGAELVAEVMARGLLGMKHEVIVISTKPQRGLTLEEAAGLRIYRFKPMNLFYYLNIDKYPMWQRAFWHLFDMFNLHSASVIRRILRQEKPDVVITHNLKGIGLLIPLVIRKLKIKHVHVLHDVQLVVPSGLILKNQEEDFLVRGWPFKIYAAICRWLFGAPTLIVSPSRWLLNFYQQKNFFGDSKKNILPNPVGLTWPATAKRSVKANKYLFVGQLKEHKGIFWLIDFWRKNNIQHELLVVGALDDLSPPVVASTVRLLGALSGASLNKIFAQVDFLIVPSLCYENSPLVIPLAYAQGVPVMVANIGGAAELVEDDKTGFVFETGDEINLRRILTQGNGLTIEQWQALSDNCLKRAADFSLDNYLAKLLALLS